VGLCLAQPAVNELADVLASPSFRIATDVNADQPRARSAANDLASFAVYIPSWDEKSGARVAHVAAAPRLILWVVQVKGILTQGSAKICPAFRAMSQHPAQKGDSYIVRGSESDRYPCWIPEIFRS
jgi:hypothetical protein